MRKRKKISLVKIIFFLYVIFLLSSVLVKMGIEPAQSSAQGGGYVHAVNLVCADGAGADTDAYLCTKDGTRVFNVQRVKPDSLKLTFEVYIFFYFSLFLLGLFEKRAYLSYLQSSMYPLARFLCDLSTRQKKDGKKQVIAFCIS